jgi:CheY-like chemotaxis protein
MQDKDTTAGYMLLAEDNPADVVLVREALEGQGIECPLRVFSDGEAMVKFIQYLDASHLHDCPKLLLLDLHLPKLDGEDVLRQLRSSERCAQTPVVILSSSAATDDFDVTRHAALHYFRKPASLVEFMKLGRVVKDIISPDTAS